MRTGWAMVIVLWLLLAERGERSSGGRAPRTLDRSEELGQDVDPAYAADLKLGLGRLQEWLADQGIPSVDDFSMHELRLVGDRLGDFVWGGEKSDDPFPFRIVLGSRALRAAYRKN